MAGLGDVLVAQEDRGADAMLQALVRLGALYIDHDRDAIRPGLAVPRELVQREVARALGRP